MGKVLSALILCAGIFCATTASAAIEEKRVCFRVPTQTTDSDVGEDYQRSPTALYATQFARVRVMRGTAANSGTIVTDTYLDYWGCITFDSSTTSGSFFSFRLYGEATPRRAATQAQFNYLVVERENGTRPSWDFFVSGSNWTNRSFNAQHSYLTNLFAIGIWSLNRLAPDRSGHTFTIRDGNCDQTSEQTSCYDPVENVLHIARVHNDKKFVIAHEMGHAVSRVHTGTQGYRNYSYSNGFGDWDDVGNRSLGVWTCEWTKGSHHMHSAEYSNAAFEEGFAQFYATATYNSLDETDGFMRYYKGNQSHCWFIICQDKVSPTIVNMEQGSTGGATAYMRNVCNCAGDPELAGECTGNHSVKNGLAIELDWARTFWDFATNSGEKPSWAQIIALLGVARNGMDRDEAYSRMLQTVEGRDALWGTSFTSRFRSSAELNGVNF